jgi:hypothetical protein
MCHQVHARAALDFDARNDFALLSADELLAFI